MAMKPRKRRGSKPEVRDEFDQVILDLARVTRVMAGGKRMRFRACVAIGDRKGRVGVGCAKGADVQLAISEATNDAKKKSLKVRLTESGTIPHEIRIRINSAQLYLKPAPVGTGIIAGSVLRQIFDLAGVQDIVGKIFGTPNKLNNARAVMCALERLQDPKQPVAASAAQEKDSKKKQVKEAPKQEEQPKKEPASS